MTEQENGAPAGETLSVRERLVEAVRNPSLPVLAGFAVVVAIVVILFQSAPVPPDSLFPLPADPRELARLVGPDDRLPGAVEEAIGAYGAGDLEQAAALLAASSAEGRAEAVRRAYLGSALVRLGRPEEALAAFEPVGGPPLPEPWDRETRWTRVIALRGAGQADEADRALADLAAGEGPLAARARRLLAAN